MQRDDNQKAELYQIMLVTVATVLLAFGKTSVPRNADSYAETAVNDADNIIQAAHKKAVARYSK